MRFISVMTLIAGAVVWASYWYAQGSTVCPVPIRYGIGEVDERFGLSREELGKIVEEAETVWEDILPQELFVYDDKSDFKINLIFDERQQMARTEEEWRERLDRQEKGNQAKIEQVKALGVNYSEKESDYKAKRAEYEAVLSAYNARVDEYNQQGGAPTEVFEELKIEQSNLSRLAKNLSRQEDDLNELASEINESGEKVNQDILAYNQEVQEYNEIFGQLEAFTQGDFERKRINIYKFSDVTELKRVLAHEFGHALGLPHVEGEESVMYYLTTPTDIISVSVADRETLIATCKNSDTLSHQVRRIIRETLTVFRK